MCSKIIFTNVQPDVLNGFRKSRASGYGRFKQCDGGEIMELDEDIDDNGLYTVCCLVTDYVIKDYVRPALRRVLAKSYGCFNRDECNLICTNVLSGDTLDEIPGRMYVYLKMNESINPEGFYRFMCRDVAAAVEERAFCEADSLLELNDKADMIETLKYFSCMSPEVVSKVVLFVGPAGIEIRECIPEKSSFGTEFSDNEGDILAELVTLNPGCIEIYGKDEFLKNDISTVIEAVFEDRIEYR